MADSPVARVRVDFERLTATVPANVGIAIARSDRTYTLGRWSSGVAWSTIKVPLAIAVLRSHRPRPQDLVVKAITESDNPASERLWSLLGEPADAAQRVQSVIAESGDAATLVESHRLRPGFTAFGQTEWALDRQARFAERLPLIPDAAVVIDLMRHITTGQHWGLAAKGVAAKGGWGPGAAGGYLVRQFGIVPIDSGHVGVALAADAHDGAFDTGVDALNAVTDWLVSHLPELARHSPA
ncbi:MAG: hypothetical protein QOD10_3292 [Mycobacterium sp.]|nr:hypothetical protein [Mycobacterium sp.]